MLIFATFHRWALPFTLAITALLVGPVHFSAGAELKQITSVEGITEYALDNGLQVLLFPDPSKSKITVNITYRVGSRHEGRGEAGMAHLLEHMVFKGTPTHPNIWGALEDHGADFNGTTWLDRTNYYETLPASEKNLAFALQMEADRMVNSLIKQEDLDKEMSVVRNEFEMGENNPMSVLGERMISAAFLWHNYGKSTIGNRSDIERVPADKLRDFYTKYYQPDNATLLVGGKFDPNQVKKLIKDKFGSIPRPERILDATYTEEPAQDGDRLVRLYRTGDVAAAGVVYHTPPGPHEDFAAVEVFEDLLTDQPAGRLYRGLVANGLATSVGGMAFALAEPGLVEVMAEVASEQAPEEVLASMVDIIEGFAGSEIDEKDVERAVARKLKAIKLAMTDSSKVGIRLSESIAQGDWRLFFIHRDRLEKVTAADIQRVAATYFIESNRTAGIFIPSDAPQRVAMPAAPDVAMLVKDYQGRAEISQGEELEPSVAFIESRIKRSELGDGIKLAILPMETRGDSVRASLKFHYGSELEIKGRTIAAALVPLMLMRGTERLDYEALQNEIDGLESRILVSGGGGHRARLTADPGNFSATIQSDREHFAACLKLLGEILKKPAFDEKEFDVVKKQEQATLEEGMSDPQTLGMLELSRALRPWPKNSIHYVPTLDEQLEQLNKVTLDQLREIHKQFYGAGNCEIAIVGDFDPAEIEPLLKDIFAGWKAPAKYRRIARPYREAVAAELEVNTPDKEMAIVATATAMPMRDDDEDYPAMVISGYVLGRSAKSRLMNRLRHEGGLSYGAGGGVNASSQDERASLTGMAICAPQNAAEAKTALQEEIRRWIADGITAQELDEARNSYELKFKTNLTDESYLLSALTSGLELGRTLEFRGKLMDDIKALTVEGIQSALKRRLGDKQMVTVRAGDPNSKSVESSQDSDEEKPTDPQAAAQNDGKDVDPNDPWAKLVTLDANKNGTLERSEVPAQWKAAFEQIDADQNGSLDREESRKITAE